MSVTVILLLIGFVLGFGARDLLSKAINRHRNQW